MVAYYMSQTYDRAMFTSDCELCDPMVTLDGDTATILKDKEAEIHYGDDGSFGEWAQFGEANDVATWMMVIRRGELAMALLWQGQRTANKEPKW